MSYYASQCFPARNLLRFRKNSDGGAWLVAYKEDQKKKFAATLCPDTSYEKRDQTHFCHSISKRKASSSVINRCRVLNGIFLLNEINVDDPSDVVYVNIAGKNLTSGETEDFVLFDNVIHIEAGENELKLETFTTFPELRELELQFNGISSLSLSPGDFKVLEFLDLSFNRITPTDVFHLGALHSLRCLHLTGNGLKVLPTEMAQSFEHETGKFTSQPLRRFHSLEVLYLDENEFDDISVFASLASLSQLKVLNLSKNKLKCVPQLRLLVSSPSKRHILSNVNLLIENDDSDMQDKSRDEKEAEFENFPAENDDNQDPELQNDAKEPHLISVEGCQAMTLNPGDGSEMYQLPDSNHSLQEFQKVDGFINDSCFLLVDEDDLSYKAKDQLANVDLCTGSNVGSGDLESSTQDKEYPFQSLEKLDLTYNLIAEDQALLPLATWPSLLEVNIWENPLTKTRKGTSSVLQYHLTDLAGIRIKRKEPQGSCKPAVGPTIAPVARYNKVNDIMPPLRRKNLLLLEFENYEAALQNPFHRAQPLPPIKSAKTRNEPRMCSSAPVRAPNNETSDHTLERPHSTAPNSIDDQHIDKNSMKDGIIFFKGDPSGVFLTQLNANDAELDVIVDKEADTLIARDKGTKNSKAIKNEESRIEYESLDELLRTDESIVCNDTPPEKDFHSNVKALKLALDNPLVFNESSHRHSGHRGCRGNWQFDMGMQDRNTGSSQKTRREKILKTLDYMKEQNNLMEENLDFVLKKYHTDHRVKRQFPDVPQLLKEIQSKYDKVRISSINSAANAHKLILSTKGIPDARMNQIPLSQKNAASADINVATCDRGLDEFECSQDAIERMNEFKEILGSRI